MKTETENALVEACQHTLVAPHGPLCPVMRDGVDVGTNCTCHVQKARVALQLYGAEKMAEGVGAMTEWWSQLFKK